MREEVAELALVEVVPSVRTWRCVAGAALGSGIVVLLVASAGFDEAGRALATLDRRVLLVAVLLETVALASLIQVYRATFRLTGGRLGKREAAAAGLGAISLTQLLPGGGVAGGLFAARRLTRAGADPVAAGMTVVLVGAVTLGTLSLLVTAATAVGAASTRGYVPHAAAAGVVTSGMVGTIALLRWLLSSDGSRDRMTTWLRTRRRWRVLAADVASHLDTHRDLLRRPAVLAPSAAWAALKWTTDLAVLAVFVDAAGGDVPLLAVLVAYAVVNLLNGLPLTPGGVGIVEVGATGTLVAFGADPAAAAVAVLGYRVVAVGLPLVAAVGFVGRDLRRASQEVAAR